MAGTYNFIINQGETFFRELEWKDSKGATVDIQTYSAKMQIRDLTTNALIIELSTSNNRITITSDSKIQLLISAADTALLNFTNAVYDLELTNNNVVKRLIEGTAKLSLEVTV